MIRKLSCITLLLVAGCGGGESASTDAGIQTSADAGLSEDAGNTDMVVEIGTGVDDFIPLTDGQAVDITLGPQGGGRSGGFHIWHAVKVWNIQPRDVLLSFKTRNADTGEEIASQERRVNLRPLGEAYTAFGISPWLLDCCKAQDQDVIMWVEVKDAADRTGTDERRVHAGQCLDASGVSVCP